MAESVDKTYSAKQVATRIGTDAKQLRKFFRDSKSGYSSVGQGGRYDFPETEIPKIKTAFDEWNATKTRRNRPTNAEKKLATAAGLIPGQRKESPGTDRTPRTRRPDQLIKDGLHGNGLDEDSFSDRTAGIGVRVAKHNLTTNQQGRFIEKPEHIRKAEETQTQELDFSEAEDREPTPAELFEPVVDPDDPDIELELEDDGDIPGTGDEEIDWEEVED